MEGCLSVPGKIGQVTRPNHVIVEGLDADMNPVRVEGEELLARALCATRKVLLLDEPVSGLDPRVTAEMYGLIRDLNREGVTVIMVSHDVGAAVRYATHILHIGHTGSRIFFGTKEEYLKSEAGKYFLAQQEGGEA